MSLKRIFKVSMVNYLLGNGAILKKVSKHRNEIDLIFHFEHDKKLDELLANYNR